MTDFYLNASITEKNPNIELSHPIRVSPNAEIGLLHCVLPMYAGSYGDTVKITETISKVMNIETSIKDSLNEALEEFSLLVHHKNNRFTVEVPEKYKLIISETLRNKMGMISRELEGSVTGRIAKNDHKGSEELIIKRTHNYRVQVDNDSDIRKKLQTLYGLDLLNPALEVSVERNKSHLQLIRILCNVAESSIVNETKQPILRMVSLQERSRVFNPVYYLSLNASELSFIRFTVLTDEGKPFSFSGKLYLGLHIKNA